MRDHDDLPYIVIERRSAGIGPFVWGALLGAGAALLLAPRSGMETQDEIRDRVRRARTAAEDRYGTARDTVTRTRDRLEEQIGSVRRRFEDVRDQIDEGAERARGAMDQGRRAARDAKEEIERRVHDARETHPDGGAAGLEGAGPASARAGGVDVVVTDVSEERTEGRSDLG